MEEIMAMKKYKNNSTKSTPEKTEYKRGHRAIHNNCAFNTRH